jgi:hypothetical protein
MTLSGRWVFLNITGLAFRWVNYLFPLKWSEAFGSSAAKNSSIAREEQKQVGRSSWDFSYDKHRAW